jgi:hypothetical protein
MNTATGMPETPEAAVTQLIGRLWGGGRREEGWRLPGGHDPVATALWHLGLHLARSPERDQDAVAIAQSISMLSFHDRGHDTAAAAWRASLERVAGRGGDGGTTPLPGRGVSAGWMTSDQPIDEVALLSLTPRAHHHLGAGRWNAVSTRWLAHRLRQDAARTIALVPGERPVSGRGCAATIVATLLHDRHDASGLRLAAWLERAMGRPAGRGVPWVIDPITETITALEVFLLQGFDRSHAAVRTGLSRLDERIRVLLDRRSGQPPCGRTLARAAVVLGGLGDEPRNNTARLVVSSLMMGQRDGRHRWRQITSPREMAAITAAVASTRSWASSDTVDALDHLMTLRDRDGMWSPAEGGSSLVETAMVLLAIKGDGIDHAAASMAITRQRVVASQGAATDPIARAALAVSRRILGDIEHGLIEIVATDLRDLLVGDVPWSDPGIFPLTVAAIGGPSRRDSIAQLTPGVGGHHS